jgi:formamidopyrimidine-DNA glycosylase
VPELPEVETVRRQLEPEVVGQTIAELEVLDDRWTQPDDPARVAAAIGGRRIEAVERRGKYLILRLAGDVALVMHLRMTGNLLLKPADLVGEAAALDLMEARQFGGPRLYPTHPEARHLRALVRLESGDELWFTDPRRFGTGGAFEAEALEAYLDARLGIEPLSPALTAEALLELAGSRTAPLKSFLLSQEGVAGIGNIYADEALHIAGLHPLSPVGSMKPEHAEALRVGIIEALEAGLANSGASMNDYLDSRGEKGSMQDEFLVHTREGQECPRCGGTIERIVVGGRSTYFCPECQVKLRRRPRRRRRARA